jgi:hypothetical protein
MLLLVIIYNPLTNLWPFSSLQVNVLRTKKLQMTKVIRFVLELHL